MSHVDDGTLHAYLDGELSPAEAQGVDAHLAQCPGCRERLEEERALIARAEELLALAAPPDRTAPPFRPGDLKPPLRFWWRARWPLAWAATVALALGIGWYAGGTGWLSRARYPAPEAALDAKALAPVAPAVAARAPDAPRPAPATTRPAAPQAIAGAVAPAPQLVAMEHAVRDSIVAAPTAAARAPAMSVASPPSLVAGNDKVAVRAALPSRIPITLDSARRLLDQDPLALPGVPIRAVHRERALGEVVVVVQQVLDSTTVIELRERRSETPPVLDEIVERGRAVLQTGAVSVEISGPLPPDSLRRLLEHVRPVKP